MPAQPPVPPQRVRLPDPTGLFMKLDDADRAFFVELIAAIQRELDLRVRSTAAQSEALFLTPSGKVYGVSMSDTGVVTSTLRYG